ncbi:hypothetical protein [Bacillus cereus group sp. BfR-BA-01400]|uniref:hypothetical protein n=1 Tax=Bacillus cereus group sp. BfR-BA-01400 TaxID=2920334 RepID=UPI001F5665EE
MLQIILFIIIALLISLGIIIVRGYYTFGDTFEKKAKHFFDGLDEINNSKASQEEKSHKIMGLEAQRKNILKKLQNKAVMQVSAYKILMKLRNKWSLMVGLCILFVVLFLVIPSSKLFYDLVSQYFLSSFVKEYFSSHSTLLLNTGKAINAAIAVFISVCLTIFTFTFRERKTISFSSNALSKNSWFFLVLTFIILNLIYGWCFLNTADILSDASQNIAQSPNIENVESKDKFNFLFSYVHANRFCIYVILTIVSVFAGMYIIGELFRSIDLRYSLGRTIKETRGLFLQYALSKKSNDYSQLSLYIESLYQLLSLSLEKNTGELFGQQFKKWTDYLDEFNPGGRQNTEGFLQSNIFNMLYLKNNEAFKEVYKVLLQSHVELITNVVKTNKLSDIQSVLKIYQALSPISNHTLLKKAYVTSLHELIMYIIENHPDRLSLVLEILESYALIEVIENKNHTLKIYKSLIIRSCEANSVRDLSQLVYSMLKTLRLPNDQSGKKKNDLIPVLHIHDDTYNKVVENNKKPALFIIIQAAIKSIELSHYACTGFIAKMLVTVFDNDTDINEVFQQFRDVKKTSYGQKNFFVEETDMSSDVVVSIKFNSSTFEYCCNKFAIILYSQYKYAVENELPRSGLNGKNDLINENVIKIDENCIIHSEKYLAYLFDKIVKAKEKYGLLFLHNEKFMEEIKQEIFLKLGYKYIQKSKYKNFITNIVNTIKK